MLSSVKYRIACHHLSYYKLIYVLLYRSHYAIEHPLAKLHMYCDFDDCLENVCMYYKSNIIIFCNS